MKGIRKYLHRQLFVGVEADGRLTWMNRVLVPIIIIAVGIAVIATEPSMMEEWHDTLVVVEALLGLVFLAEYGARIFAAAEQPAEGTAWRKRWRFIFSPLSLIDLLVIVSSLSPLFVADTFVLRMVRLLRVLAAMKFSRFSHALHEVLEAVVARADDLLVTVALSSVGTLIAATALYLVEGEVQPEVFGSIPRSLYWAIITLTQVGYGDAVPITPMGKVLASLVSIIGIGLVAMPIGILAAAFSEAMQKRRDARIDDLRHKLEQLNFEDRRLAAKLEELERLKKQKL